LLDYFLQSRWIDADHDGDVHRGIRSSGAQYAAVGPRALATNRMMELVIHIDDLAVSAGVPTPELPNPATDAVIGILATLAARRHGTVPVLRALTRAERAPATITAF
jgi:hypothetical protein